MIHYSAKTFNCIIRSSLLLLFVTLIGVLTCTQVCAQVSDSMAQGSMVVHSDYRLQLLGKKEAELNSAVLKSMERSAFGYRLQVLSTNDKDLAFKTRTQLLQRFPEQKVYMYFLAPYVKLEFGNFRTKQEADPYKKMVSQMLGGASIYYLNKRIEVKPVMDLKENDPK